MVSALLLAVLMYFGSVMMSVTWVLSIVLMARSTGILIVDRQHFINPYLYHHKHLKYSPWKVIIDHPALHQELESMMKVVSNLSITRICPPGFPRGYCS
jgi:hypothetical protein